MTTNKILLIVTSNDRLGNTGEKTGLHYEEMATPYYYFKEQGFEVDIASTAGGKAPIDPSSFETDAISVEKFKEDQEAQGKINNTINISNVNVDNYDGAYIPGGHGTMWDMPDHEALIKVLETFWAQGKPIASVCHGPAAFVNIKDENGEYIVKDRDVNCFTDAEEVKVEKDDIVPFLLETRLRENGGKFTNAGLFEACSVRDGNLITGQNPASAIGVAEKLNDAIQESASKREAA